MPDPVVLIDSPSQLAPVLHEARACQRVAVDIESNGLHAYRQRLCTTQLAWTGASGQPRLAIVDTLAIDPAHLSPLFGDRSITKILHDLSFDARMLASEGVPLAGVHDTSVAAAYLGHQSLGLASLVESEFGVRLDKSMQASNWGRRPLSPASLQYLANDVRYLLELDSRLMQRVNEAGIADEVATETDHKLASALEVEPPVPAFVRIRGADTLDDLGKCILKALAEVRDSLACEQDVPLFRIAPDRCLVAIARSRTSSLNALAAQIGRRQPRHVLQALAQAVERGRQRERLDDDDSQWFTKPCVDRAWVETRKAIERRLADWRKRESARRGLPEQVILPSHCLRHLASRSHLDAAAIATIPGLGTSRANRYAAVLARLLTPGTQHSATP